LNETLLQDIARATDGGTYLPLRGAKTIDTLYDQWLSKLPKSEHEQKIVKRFEERYQWPLGFAMVLLLIEFLLPERKREPSKVLSAAGTKSVLQGAVTLLLVMLWTADGLASPSSALREYKAGNYGQAFKEYEQLLQQKADDPRLHFNAGAAAYRDQQFSEAAKQFNAAISSPDLKLQQLSYYNRGNAEYWMGEKNQDPGKRTESWEKAIKDYELSMKLNSQDPDARFNHDFVKKKLEELKKQQEQQKQQPNNIQPSEEAKKAKAAADEAVRLREYAKALDIMDKQLQKDQTTQYYADYMQRLKEVTGVQSTTKP
jgi:Ca-activated chloride channel family protein